MVQPLGRTPHFHESTIITCRVTGDGEDEYDISAISGVINAAAPDGTPPRRMDDGKQFPETLLAPLCLRRGPEARNPHDV
jgi:hypothetical protein